MITKIELTNFKSHAHTVIEPGRVTALVGPNGCGKTAIMQAVYLGLQLSKDKDLFFDGNAPVHLIKQGQLACTALFSGKKNVALWQWGYELSPINESQPKYQPYKLFCWGEGIPHNSKNGIPSARMEEVKQVADAVEQGIYFKAVFHKLSATSYSEDIPPHINSDGAGLAATLAYLILTVPEHHLAIETSLKEIVPTVKKVRARPALVKLTERKMFSVNGTQVPYDEERGVMGYELVFDTTSAKDLPAHVMSDGTLLTLGLLTLLHSSTASQLFLLDDIEAGLHPLAQRQLMQTLKDFAEKHDRQIILTSHSPYIIDELPAEDVWVMAMDKEGISRCNRLSNHPDKDRALEVLTTGEFLSAEGEEWVIDNPFPAETVNA